VPFGDPGGAGAGLHPRLLHQVDDHGFDDVDLGRRVAEVPVPGPVRSGGHAFLHDHERGRLPLPGPVTEDGYAEGQGLQVRLDGARRAGGHQRLPICEACARQKMWVISMAGRRNGCGRVPGWLTCATGCAAPGQYRACLYFGLMTCGAVPYSTAAAELTFVPMT